ncbi:hypothetical protein [uncultured Aggregatibacter sp.]|uniref:InlB B-repeat-containing protein n=1 Tax=uncultured Aggregatibacter sp. TaxID=470564 RepID=UPI002595EC6A|nr:hypothetical protein [uncultured Aggregatibacter sp.]
MKTKISHLGRSSVSVILAVMMLLSTMLVGTMPIASAASTLQPTTGEVADGYYRIFVTDNYNFNSAPLIHYWGGSSATDWNKRPTMNKVIGTNAQGESVYWYDVPSGSEGVIFQHPEKNQSVDLNVKTDQNLKFGNGAGYYISSENENKTRYIYAYWDASSLLPQETKPDVADSVTLEANPTSVKVGNSVTLTPTVISAKPGNLTYTYNKITGGTATEVKNADNSLTVTPTVAGTYKYTVTVSADGYSPVTSNEVSFTVTAPVDYYLAGRIKQNGSSDWVNSIDSTYKFTQSDTEGLYYYKSIRTPKRWSDTVGGLQQYFYIIDSSSKMYGSKDNSSSNTPKILYSTNDKSTLEKINSTSDTKTLTYINNQEDTSVATFWLDTRNNEYKLWYTTALPHTVTVAEGVPASVDKTEFAKGETVTVTATSVPQGQILDTVTVMGADKTPVTTTVSGNSATFTMPDQNVTVTKVTFRKAKEFKVTIASDITYGTVKANDSPSEITVTEGTPVRLVATPNDSYYFSSWSITPPDGYTAKDSMTSATETIYPTNNITVSAFFTQGTESTDHFLAWGDKAQYSIGNWTHGVKTYSSKDKNGYTVYTAELDPSFFEQNAWYCFAVTNKIPSSGDRLRQDDLLYNNENTTVNGYKEYHDHVGDNVKTERKNDSGNYFGMFQYYSGKLESLSISYNEGTHNYQVTPVIKVHNEAKLYAKNGSCRTDGKYPNNMHEKGITTISYNKDKYVVDVDDKSSKSYQLAYLSEGNIKDEVKLTITTKVTDSEYYLAGWCVDGETYLPKTSNTESNEYSFDYYVKSTTKPNDIIEVTPVYFYRTSTGTETVRFYVTGFDDTVKKDWGNTIAVYPYYSGGKGNVFSNYPGQPMLVSGGRYYVDLPITYNGGRIAGVTLNNYYYDDVHKNLVSDNRQTYDYNDFLKIYEQKIEGSTGRKSQEIIFSFKYVPSDNSVYNNNFGDKPTNKGDKTSDTYPDTILAKDMEKVYKNGWEDLTDFYGNKVDLYNQKVDASTEAGKKNPWRVISNGYEQTYFGYYATRWAVYKPVEDTGDVTRYSLVDVISSSSLLYNSYDDILADTNGDNELSASSDASAYKAFEDAHARGVPVKITYEQTILRGKSIEEQPVNAEYAYRNDGRWYYSEDNLDVTAHTVIEYAETLDGFSGKLGESFFRDYYQKDEEGGVDYTKAGYDSSKYTGLETKTSAYFTNKDYYQKTEAKGRTGSDKTFDIIANTDHTSQYIFVGWYLLSEGKYSPLTATVENSVSVPQDNNDVYVARFIKAPSGSLTISHTLHPDATGLGKCYVSVDVLDSTDKVIHHYDETTSDITVSNAYITYNQGYKIKITLKTEPGEASTFNDFYSYSNGFAKLVNTQTGEVPAVIVTNDPSTKTYKAEISFNVDYLFDEGTDHQQKIKVLNYYSQLSLGEVNYQIRYTFTTRLYGKKVYKVSGVLTKEDIEKYGCSEKQLSESFVMAKAPFESNFKQNITWDSNQIKFDTNADGTLTAAITAKQVEDKAVTATFYVDSVSPFETITTTFGNRFFKDGSYISAKPTGTTAEVDGLPTEYQNSEGKFSFWYVMTKNGEFVTKAYGQNFAYTGYDNYIVVAVYGVEGTHKDVATDSSINFLQYSRNHWNDTVSGNDDDTGSYSLANKDYDRLYADFNLMFNHNGWLLNNYSGTNIQVGYAMVVGSKKDGDYTVNETELENAISKNATDGGNVEHQSTSKTAKQAVTVTGSDNDGAKKNVIVNSIRIADLDNKNRITSYYGFKNSEANQSYYVKVYSYVIVDSEVTLSKTPVVINLKDIGTMTYESQP